MAEKLDYKDYEKLGLKCGIEIHQRLNTRKLFCNCPSVIREDKPHFTVIRRQKAVVGESDEFDIAALHETKRNITFEYEGYYDTTCLIEIDEEPPMEMNEEAFQIVLQVCKILGCKIVDEVQVMRKTIVNGSNVSGFQRTALVGRNGKIKTSFGDVRIPTVMIEEESAKDIRKEKDKIVYRLDRLGIPLIEISTEPEMKTPEQVKEVCEYIGMVLRSTGKAMRGIGSIRQDLNISIKEGARVEIKGAQELKTIPLWIEYEVLRQKNLIEIKKELGNFKELKPEKIELTNDLKNSQSKVLGEAFKKNGVVFGIKLEGFNGYIGREIQPGRRLGSEFSDYAKIKAGVSGILHSDELPKYGITQQEVDIIKKKLGCKDKDGFVIIADEKQKVISALDAVIERANLVKQGVIKEVRKPNADGTTSFMRPLPGAARMYPETDVLPIKPDIKNIKVPKLLIEKEDDYIKLGLSKDLARLMVRSDKSALFEECLKFKNIKPAFIAEMLLPKLLEIKRKYNVDVDNVNDDMFIECFRKLNDGKISKDAIEDILIKAAKGEKVDFDSYMIITGKELEEKIKSIVNKNKNNPKLTSLIMAELKGKADPKEVMELIKKLI